MKEYLNSETGNNVFLTKEKKEQKEGFHFFYIFPILYVLSFYLLPFFLAVQKEDSPSVVLLYLPLVFGIVNIIVSIVFCKPENRIMMLNASVLIKYAMIPFFIIGGLGVLASMLMIFIPVPIMLFMAPAVAVMGVVAGWLVLAFEAPYVISYLILSLKEGIRPTGMVVLHSVFQFFFVADVIDVMFLTLKEKKWKKLTISMIILLALCLIIAILLIIIGIIKMIIN